MELSDRLKREGYDSRFYSFDRNSPPFEGYILENVSDRWAVFFFERGEAHDLANFKSEYDACEYFYRVIQRALESTTERPKH